MKTTLNKAKRLAVIFGVAALILLIVAGAAYYLFFYGYQAGLPTKDSNKVNIKQMICFHDWTDRSGICMKCGLKCTHPAFDDNGNCKVCNFHHTHKFKDGICTECGATCPHKSWSKGYCIECGAKCEHPEWVDDVCTVCGLFCKHLTYKDGKCAICGTPCPHSNWENGKCKTCGLECDHADHDPKTAVCNICGMKVYHDFTTGVCSCGITPPFRYGQLPDSLLEECNHKGAVTTITYSTKKYNEDNEYIKKNMDIYTPYGYNKNTKYNVLLMIHGENGHYYDWTTNPITVGTLMSNPKTLYDNMIDQMICKPLIIVSVSSTYFGENGETEAGYKQLAPEIRNDILPFIVEHYSTYAEGTTTKAISEARNHFGIGGVNEGANYAYECGMVENFDLFANFICLSGCSEPSKYANAINVTDYRDYDIVTYFNGAGTLDPQRGSCYDGYEVISGSTDRLQDGINSFYVECETSGKDWISATTLMHDALIVAFAVPKTVEAE